MMIVSNRNVRRFATYMGLIVIVGCTFLLVYADNLSTSCGGEYSRPTVEIAKTAHLVPKGTVLTSEMVIFEAIPERFLPPNPVLRADADEFFNRPTNVRIEAGAMILTSDFDRVSPTWRSSISLFRP